MANKLILKKSSVVAKTPLATDLEYGELALNYADEKLYFKNAANAIKSFNVNAAALTIGTGLSGGSYDGSAPVTIAIDSSVVTLNGVQSLTNKTFTDGLVVSTNTSTNALRITQVGTGNALIVEDEANPDSTPFVVDASGKLIIGHNSDIGSGAGALQIKNADMSLLTYSNDAFVYGVAKFHKSRSTTPGSFTTVQANDELGFLFFRGDNGSSFNTAAYIGAIVDGTPGTDDMPGRLVFATTADGASAPTERIRIRSDGNIAFGGVGNSSIGFNQQKNITGGTNAYAHAITAPISSDVTGTAFGYYTGLSTTAASFTVGTLRHYTAFQNALGAGSAVTNQYGFTAGSSLTGATNNYGFYGDIASGTGRWNFYANGTASNYFRGNVGIGSTSLTGINLNVGADVTGATVCRAIQAGGTIKSDVTNTVYYYGTSGTTENAAFTLTSLVYYFANQSTFGAGSAVTNQYGFRANSTLIGATRNYGFYGDIASGTDRFNFYAAGTAANYFAGATTLGSNLNFTGTGNRITGDFSNATIANRVIFQTSTVNGGTQVRIIPNGTSNQATLQVGNNTDTANQSVMSINVSATEATLLSFTNGTGTLLPMVFSMGGVEAVRVTTDLNVGVGTSTPASKLDVAGTLTVSNGGAISIPSTSIITAFNESPIDSTGHVFTQKIYPTISYAGTDFVSGDSIISSEISAILKPSVSLPSGTLFAYGLSAVISTDVNSVGTFSNHDIRAVYGNVYHYSNSNLPRMVGVAGRTYNRGTGTVTDAYSLWARNNTNTGGGGLTSSHGLYIDNITSAVNNYGITSLVSAGANKWNIYASGTANNHFAGNVGIGTTSLSTAVSIGGATSVSLGISISPQGWNSALHRLTVPTSGDTSVWSFNYSGSAVDYSGYATSSIGVGNGAILFSTNTTNTAPTERMRIDSAGNVGIGTTAPIEKLHINGNIVVGGSTGFTSTTNNGAAAITGIAIFPYTLGGITNSTTHSTIVARNDIEFVGTNGTSSQTYSSVVSAPKISNSGAGGSGSTTSQSFLAWPTIQSSGSSARLTQICSYNVSRRENANDTSTNSNNSVWGAAFFVGHESTLPTTASTRNVYGTYVIVANKSGITTDIRAHDATVQVGLTSVNASATTAAGFYLTSFVVGSASANTATVTSGFGLRLAGPTVNTTGTITDYYAVYAGPKTGAGSITNNYGVYIADTTATNVFAGQTSIGGLLGAESLRVTPVTSAVNYLQAAGAPTGTTPILSAQGSDASINLGFLTKGTGSHVFSTGSASGNIQFRIDNISNSVNYLVATGGITGSGAVLSTVGSDTNINLILTPKGTGNVGIGTTAADARLHITNASKTSTTVGANSILRVQSNGSGADVNIQFSDGVAHSAFIGMNSGAVYFSPANTEQMRITSAGNVGIGTTTPAYKLSVQGPAEIRSASAVHWRDAANTNFTSIFNNSGSMVFETNYIERMRLDVSGNLGIGTATPAAKLQVDQVGIQTTTTALTTTTQTIVYSYAAATFRTAELMCQIVDSTNSQYHSAKFMVIHNSTDVWFNQTNVIHSHDELGTFTVNISGGNVRLLFTPTAATTKSIKVAATMLTS